LSVELVFACELVLEFREFFFGLAVRERLELFEIVHEKKP